MTKKKGKVEKHSGQTGAEKHGRTYIDPDYAKRKRKEREDLQRLYDHLAGPVEIKRKCLLCDRTDSTHRFDTLGGPRGWLCEDHKDDPVDGYGEQQRRSHPEE